MGRYDDAALRRRSGFVEFDLRLEGYKEKALPLRWQLIDARAGDQLGESRDPQIVPEASTDKASWDLLDPIAPTARAARLCVPAQLYEQRGNVPMGA